MAVNLEDLKNCALAEVEGLLAELRRVHREESEKRRSQILTVAAIYDQKAAEVSAAKKLAAMSDHELRALQQTLGAKSIDSTSAVGAAKSAAKS